MYVFYVMMWGGAELEVYADSADSARRDAEFTTGEVAVEVRDAAGVC